MGLDNDPMAFVLVLSAWVRVRGIGQLHKELAENIRVCGLSQFFEVHAGHSR